MMTDNLLRSSVRVILGILLLGFATINAYPQKHLAGNLNQPKTHVSSISTDRVIVDNVTGFAANDTVLLIQMQGVKIYTDPGLFGYLENKFGEPGLYEFLIIQSINTGTREVVFRNNILSAYDIRGNIQLIRVPYYNSVDVTGTLSADGWNPTTKTGGVLALIVGRTVRLRSNIDMSSLGFMGGAGSTGDGICQITGPAYQLDYYDQSYTNAGFKGEGVANYTSANALLSPGYLKGKSPSFNGGGGGNGKYSGGGGGSLRGVGGIGGSEDPSRCLPLLSVPMPGGTGGVKAEDLLHLMNRIFLGGGGGASTTSAAGTTGPGGRGGGIVIIVTDSIVGNGGHILANGGDGSSSTGTSGAAGGGAGGSIALSLNSYGLSAFSLQVKGGKGGDSNGTGGEGGGGGGGLLWVSTDINAPVTAALNEGTRGAPADASLNPAGAGEKIVGYKAVLNGFLFNSIRSYVTGNQEDSVCSNMIPPKITGTKPVGGTGPYTYLWEKSYNLSVWQTLTNDADPTNYTPTAPETTTVYYRRTITDASLPSPLIDVSKPVRIIVQPFIKNNIVGNSDTLCFSQDPPAFTSKAVLQDGNGKYTFNWQVSLNNSLFATPANSHNAASYTPPPALKNTSWYRRTVSSGRCIDSTAIVKITVLDSISNNRILNSPPDICYGMTFANVSGSTTSTSPNALQGGDNLFRYKWESNINGGGWTTAPGVSNGTDYNPVELAQRAPSNQYIYRRVVYSGSNDVCSSVSNAVLLKDFPVISNNTIAPVPAICSGSAPAKLAGSISPLLAGGNGVFTYSWQDSTKAHTWAVVSGASQADYQPPVLTDTTRYRRITNSSACSSISKSTRVVVHKPISGNSISLPASASSLTICSTQLPGQLTGSLAVGGTNIPGDYAYQWKSSPDNSVYSAVSSGGTGINYTPPALSATTFFIRDVISGACSLSSNSVSVTVLPLISNNIISGNAAVCYSRIPAPLTGGTLAGGSGSFTYQWQQSNDGGSVWGNAAGVNNTTSYQPEALYSPIKYRRIVVSGTNGCCTSTSNEFSVSINPLPVSTINAGPDTMIYSMYRIYHMKAVQPVSGETGAWTVLDNGPASLDNENQYNTTVRKLNTGLNSFRWTISRGDCQLKDSVNINLQDDKVPQGFSPNGDIFNNTFIIEGLNRDDNYVDLKILNGAGAEVFSTTNRGSAEWKDWDGKNSSGLDMPEGTYYYLLKTVSKFDGSTIKKSGFIILKRY